MGPFQTARRIAGALILASALAGCEGVQDTSATVSQHTPNATGGAISSVPTRAITVTPFTMTRGVGVLPGRIGERTTVGNVSMGYVTLSPPPEALFTQAIKAELTAAGHGVAGGPSRVSGTVERFALSTPATAVYWDVKIDAALKVTVNGTSRRYAELCVQRTYAWPSDSLISGLANACVAKIAARFRQDKGIANAL
ncbi:hypothetical protein LCL97_01330 [Seohaeicola saemankumensis]|nr:hypothetical protein [Seohaeicola saemankumensis]MCA0869454.1 hypothetical protein [Seohaeicola saemankumensis]